MFVGVGLMHRAWNEEIPLAKLVARDRLMVEALVRAHMSVYVLVGPAGPTTHIGVTLGARTVRFDGLPTYEDLGGEALRISNNKTRMKRAIAALGAPVAESRTFWWWQRRAARAYAKALGRSVVKPEQGTMDRHVNIDVNGEAFDAAFNSARRFGPRIIVEAYVPHTVARVTVIGGEKIFAVQYEPPRVIGDGTHAIGALIERANADPARADMGDASRSTHKLVLGEETNALLSAQGMTLESVPAPGTCVRLRRDPFVRNGSEFVDVSDSLHDDFKATARSLARGLNALAVGVDCIAEDFSRPLKGQTFVVLECNPVPFIDLHATSERPQEIADAVVKELLRATGTART